MEDVDMTLRIYHTGIKSGDLKVGQSGQLDKLLAEHMPSRDSSPTPAKRQRVAGAA